MAGSGSEQDDATGSGRGVLNAIPVDQLKKSAQNLALAVVERGAGALGGKVETMTRRLEDYVARGGPGNSGPQDDEPAKEGSHAETATSGVKDAVQRMTGRGSAGSGGGRSGGNVKITNIVEKIDVGVPVRFAYDQWTEFEQFPRFTRKVGNVEQESDEALNWTARVFLSDRTWKATILEQIPDDRIIWSSEGSKGFVHGAVSFHALAPNMTRILLVLEYHPHGFVEKTGNLWRAQGRRVRADLRHFERHVMTRSVLAPDDVGGWRGEIRDGEVVHSHEQAVREEHEDDVREDEDGGPDDTGEQAEPQVPSQEAPQERTTTR